MMTLQELERMRLLDPLTVNRDELVDIRDIKINMELPKEERILEFIKQIGNPYLYKCDNLVVQSVFAETEVTLTDCLKQHFRMV